MAVRSLLIISYDRLLLNATAGQAVMCGLVEAAITRGFEVSYLGLIKPDRADTGEIEFHPATMRFFREEIRINRARGNRIDRFVAAYDQSRLESLAADSELLHRHYDRVIAYDSLPIAVAKRVKAASRIAILGDPVGERYFRSSFIAGTIKRALLGRMIKFLEQRHFRFELDPTFKVAMFGSRHAREWSQSLARTVLDLRPFLLPTPDDLISLNAPARQQPLVFAFGGTLQGTASKLAYQQLTQRILPVLRLRLARPFVLNIVGEVSDEYRRLAECPHVRLLGRVPDFESALSRAHVFLLPMRYPVGVRTRVCAALQAGCAVIADPSVLENMPELKNCSAVAIAENADQYIPVVDRMFANADSYQAMRRAARRFFLENYDCHVAAAPILNEA